MLGGELRNWTASQPLPRLIQELPVANKWRIRGHSRSFLPPQHIYQSHCFGRGEFEGYADLECRASDEGYSAGRSTV